MQILNYEAKNTEFDDLYGGNFALFGSSNVDLIINNFVGKIINYAFFHITSP